MDIRLPEQIDQEKWLQLLHVTGEPEPMLRARMEEAQAQLFKAAQPRCIYRVLPLSQVVLEGFSIVKHLEGCDRAAVMAVTLGTGVDELITRSQVTGMAMAVVIDAGASVLVEQIADFAEAQINEELSKKIPGVFTTPRFSPGYGDYPLHCQRGILTLADAPRKIGLTLTRGDMMIPRKSVTALIGLADQPVSGRLATCSECVLREKCTFREAGRHC